MSASGRARARTAAARAFVARLRRFVPAAARGMRRDVRARLRVAWRFPTVRLAAANVRRAWVRSDPAWMEHWLARIEPSPEELGRRAELERERMATRARLAHTGPAVYAGVLEARVAGRGVRMVDRRGQPDVQDWLCDVLGLDGHHGDSVRARLCVELLLDDPPLDTDAG